MLSDVSKHVHDVRCSSAWRRRAGHAALSNEGAPNTLARRRSLSRYRRVRQASLVTALAVPAIGHKCGTKGRRLVATLQTAASRFRIAWITAPLTGLTPPQTRSDDLGRHR